MPARGTTRSGLAVFLEVLKLLAGILLCLPALLGVFLMTVWISILMDPGRSNRGRMRFYGFSVAVGLVALSVLAGAGAVYLIWTSLAALFG